MKVMLHAAPNGEAEGREGQSARVFVERDEWRVGLQGHLYRQSGVVVADAGERIGALERGALDERPVGGRGVGVRRDDMIGDVRGGCQRGPDRRRLKDEARIAWRLDARDRSASPWNGFRAECPGPYRQSCR